MSEDLWPEIEAGNLRSPRKLLLEQAEYLSKKTKNILEVDVKTTGENSTKIVHNFNLVAPSMDNYKFNLFQVKHPVIYYPIEVVEGGKSSKIENEKAFIEKLKSIFNSENTRKIIGSLYAQSIV